jgi:hypothetical protein
VASEEQIVLRCDGHGVAHEDGGVDGESGGHTAGYTVGKQLR